MLKRRLRARYMFLILKPHLRVSLPVGQCTWQWVSALKISMARLRALVTCKSMVDCDREMARIPAEMRAAARQLKIAERG